MMNHTHTGISFKPGDLQVLLEIRSEIVEDEHIHRKKVPKSDYGNEIIPWKMTWPIRYYENGIIGEFVFHTKGRKQFKTWDEINSIYHLHMESQHHRWEVLQLESTDCEVFSIPLHHMDLKALVLNTLESIYKEKWLDLYFEIPLSFSIYNNPIHGRHDVLGNKRDMFLNDDLSEFEYRIDVFRIRERQELGLKYSFTCLFFLLIPILFFQISLHTSFVNFHDNAIFHIVYIMSYLCLVALIPMVIYLWITMVMLPEPQTKTE